MVHRVVDWGSYEPRVKHELYVYAPLVHAQNIGGGHIRLSWADEPAASQYTYYHSLDGVSFNDSASTADTSVTYTDLDPGLVHYFKVAFQETTEEFDLCPFCRREIRTTDAFCPGCGGVQRISVTRAKAQTRT